MSGATKLTWPIEGLDLTEAFGLVKPEATGAKRLILKLSTASGDYALKGAVITPKKLKDWNFVLDFLHTSQFTDYVGPLKTKDGRYFIQVKDKSYSLMPWFAGRECRLNAPEDTLIYAQTLGRLHQTTGRIASNKRTWPQHWRQKVLELQALEHSCKPVNPELAALIPAAIDAGKTALSLCQNKAVNDIQAKPLVICHHDLTYRNFLISPQGTGYLIDFDMATPDTPARDLAQLLLNTLKANHWLPQSALPLIHAYAEEYPLTQGELGLALAFMSFPRSLWSLPKRLEPDSGNDPVALTRQVKSALSRQTCVHSLSKLLGI